MMDIGSQPLRNRVACVMSMHLVRSMLPLCGKQGGRCEQ